MSQKAHAASLTYSNRVQQARSMLRTQHTDAQARCSLFLSVNGVCRASLCVGTVIEQPGHSDLLKMHACMLLLRINALLALCFCPEVQLYRSAHCAHSHVCNAECAYSHVYSSMYHPTQHTMCQTSPQQSRSRSLTQDPLNHHGRFLNLRPLKPKQCTEAVNNATSGMQP
jgi:hypothetical protein